MLADKSGSGNRTSPYPIIIVVIIIIVCGLLSAGCSPEAKYKYLSIFVDDVPAPGKAGEKAVSGETHSESSAEEVREKTDLYPGDVMIKHFPSNQFNSEENMPNKSTD